LRQGPSEFDKGSKLEKRPEIKNDGGGAGWSRPSCLKFLCLLASGSNAMSFLSLSAILMASPRIGLFSQTQLLPLIAMGTELDNIWMIFKPY
jgi:hypothetical protein